MDVPRFEAKTGSRASFLGENKWLSVVSWEILLAEPSFLGKTGGKASFLGENKWLSLVSWGKQVTKHHF